MDASAVLRTFIIMRFFILHLKLVLSHIITIELLYKCQSLTFLYINEFKRAFRFSDNHFELY